MNCVRAFAVILVACLVALCQEQGRRDSSPETKELVGSAIAYDKSLASRTSQGDFVVEVEAAKGNKYVRLLYAPNGFSFDAPRASKVRLLPQEMFTDSSLVWVFKAHSPRNEEEKGACTSVEKRFAPLSDGTLEEVERYTAVRGQSVSVPKPDELLTCLILESWTQRAGR